MTQIEQSELEEISTLRNNLATVVSEAGQTTLQINLLETDVEELRKQLQEQTQKFKELLSQEQTLIKRLSEKYGVGAINFETGEFTPEN
jgi:capsule polysaccharide export protein KpsE/RkpR